jgi:hypothetical protein
MTKLLVATGYRSGAGELASVEVVNLDESNPDLICPNLPDLPFGIHSATGQIYNRKHPMICGGSGRGFSHTCECHSFKDGAWQSIHSLNECRRALASAVFSNPNTNEDDDIIFITGGYNGSKVLSTVESFDGNVWNQTMFADLPTTIDLHCMVKINNTMLLQIGGTIDNFYAGATESTYFLDIILNKWIPGPKLNIRRIHQSCAVMNWMNPDTNNEQQVSDQAFKIIFWQELTYLDDKF